VGFRQTRLCLDVSTNFDGNRIRSCTWSSCVFFATTYARRMSPLDRRSFLAVTAAPVACLKTFAEPASQTSALTLRLEEAGSTIPLDFVGLSYEMQQITAPDFFFPQNKELIAQFRTLPPPACCDSVEIPPTLIIGSPRRRRQCRGANQRIHSVLSLILMISAPPRPRAETSPWLSRRHGLEVHLRHQHGH